jgi:cyclopropane-fatty-acyl-phospholipid synthase
MVYFIPMTKRWSKHRSTSWRACTAPCNYGALQLKPGMRLLDIGAGWGGVHQYCGPRGIHVTALTLTEDSYNYTDSLIKRMKLKNCSIILDDFLNHHPKEPYDAVVIYGVVEHIPYYRKFCERIWACLKPGGRLYLDAAAALEKYDVNDFARNYIWRGTHTFLCLRT